MTEIVALPGLAESARDALNAFEAWVCKPPREDEKEWGAFTEAMFALAQHVFVPKSPEYEAFLGEYLAREESPAMEQMTLPLEVGPKAEACPPCPPDEVAIGTCYCREATEQESERTWRHHGGRGRR